MMPHSPHQEQQQTALQQRSPAQQENQTSLSSTRGGSQMIPVGPLDTPKRPLSGYNIFFSSERKRILQEVQKITEEDTAEDDRSATSSVVASASVLAEMPGSYTREQVFQIPIERDNRVIKSHRKNKNGKTFGSFATIIGKRWKNLDPQTRGFFEERSRMERVHYRSKVKEQKKQKKNLLANMVKQDAVAVSSSTNQVVRSSTPTHPSSSGPRSTSSNSLIDMVAAASSSRTMMEPSQKGTPMGSQTTIPTLSLAPQPSFHGNLQATTSKDSSHTSSSSSVVSHDHDLKDAWNHEMECKKFLMASNLENLSAAQLALEAQMKTAMATKNHSNFGPLLSPFPQQSSQEHFVLKHHQQNPAMTHKNSQEGRGHQSSLGGSSFSDTWQRW